MFVILIDFIIMCLYGSFKDAAPLDALCLLCFLILLLETIVRLAATGFRYFW